MPKGKIADKFVKKKISNNKLNSLFKNFKIDKEQPVNLDKLEELEEELDEEEQENSKLNLQNLEFHQFMNALEETEPGSPALERRAMAAPRPIFVGGMPQGPISDNGEEGSKDGFKYVPGAVDANEPKYIPTAESWGTPAERINMEILGRRQEFFPQANQEAFFERASETRGFSSQNVETAGRVERFDIERESRRNPFEREEAKYEKYKPKLPKS